MTGFQRRRGATSQTTTGVSSSSSRWACRPRRRRWPWCASCRSTWCCRRRASPATRPSGWRRRSRRCGRSQSRRSWRALPCTRCWPTCSRRCSRALWARWCVGCCGSPREVWLRRARYAGRARGGGGLCAGVPGQQEGRCLGRCCAALQPAEDNDRTLHLLQSDSPPVPSLAPPPIATAAALCHRCLPCYASFTPHPSCRSAAAAAATAHAAAALSPPPAALLVSFECVLL